MRRRWRAAAAGLLPWACAALAGCAAPHAARVGEPFHFARDTFAFANDTVWEYRLDDAHGRTAWSRREPPPAFSLRCGNMARGARQFRLHARFDPERPPARPEAIRAMIATVLSRDARATAPSADPVTIPGFSGLRELSAAHEELLKDALGGPWHSHMQRGNWRMIFPFPPGRQRAEAERLRAALERGETPILHVLRFPALTLNHVVLLYAFEETPEDIRFGAYDPNDASGPVTVRWDRAARTFVYPATPYFAGGPVKAYAIYDGLLG
jgi:hypothetical protein